MTSVYNSYESWSNRRRRGDGGENMESETDREIQIEERIFDSRKRRRSPSGSGSDRRKEENVVGMILECRRNGFFSEPSEVAKILVKRVGEVRSVRITRSGMAIIDCETKQQMGKVLRIQELDNKTPVKCFQLGTSTRRRGVISGVSLSVYDGAFKEIDGVCEARRMMCWRNGVKEESRSIMLVFEGEIPERVYHKYVCYRVRPYEVAPLRCYCCQEYGHVAAVCRATPRCGSCGKTECEKRECEKGKEQRKPTCLHCGGPHHVGSMECPRRAREAKVKQIRRQGRMSYADAVKELEGNERQKMDERASEVEQQSICIDKRGFLAFISMVINCAVEIKRKSERIKMVLDAANRFLNVVDITGEELDEMLREGCAPSQA